MASLIVYSPSGGRTRVDLNRFPFVIGRQPGNSLVLADQRISRYHARIESEGGRLMVEDLGSRHGLLVNSINVQKQTLNPGDIIEFGVDNSYQLQFASDEAVSDSGLEKLREVLEIARGLEQTATPARILESVVDAALRLTHAERGFLFLRRSGALEMAAARDHDGRALGEDSLRVPRRLIEDALTSKREAFAINFDDQESIDPGQTVLALKLQSSIFVPLPRADGLLYLDSRADQANMASGNRELLQTLALEAATALESARRFEEQRARHRLEEELDLAKNIQENLLPRELPSTGWLRAAGSSMPTRYVGGDYFDVHSIDPDRWAVSMADVSGKGAGAALLASLLQGALMMASGSIEATFAKVNSFLLERTQGEKYATVFYGVIDRTGHLQYSNAGHCRPTIVSRDNVLTELDTTGIPIGLVADTEHSVASYTLRPGDKLIVYSDGYSENVSHEGMFDGLASLSASGAHAALINRLRKTDPEDDVTLLVLEFNPR